MRMGFQRLARGLAFLSLAAWFGFEGKASGQSDGQGEPAVAMGAGRGVQGTVTAVAADRLTVRTERGDIYQVAVSANTRVLKGRDPIRFADVRSGDGVGAMGELDLPNKTVHALYVVVVDAEQIKKAREALGKSWISGTVTAINETRLTILRLDQVSQVIAVDEDTSFRRGGRGMQMSIGAGRVGAEPEATTRETAESLTLLDVKVGALVAGPGSLKNGVFVVTTLGISDATAGRGRRRQGSAAGLGTAPAQTEPKQR